MPGALRPRRHGDRETLGESLDGLGSSSARRGRAGYDRLSPVYLADYATADDGTGIVHSAPAYGVEDFNSCRAHGLALDDILNPVQGNGVYETRCRCSAACTSGRRRRLIVDALRDAGRLFASSTLVHSYPHCWRHKTPVIYRAAAQWFVRMDDADESTAGVFATTRRRRPCASGARRDRRDRRSIPRTAAPACTT